MTRSRLWWLMHVAALLPLIGVPPSFCQHTENRKLLTSLLAIKSNKSGLEIHTLFPENRGSIDDSQWPDNELEPQTLFIPGHSLSSECGYQYFRCQELLVINEYVCQFNDTREFSIVFVPLENGVILLSYSYDSNNMTMERSIFTVNSSDCSPTVFYNINGKIYTVCISTEYEYVAVYEVWLNLTGSIMEFKGASLIEPWVTSIRISTSHSSSFSNFIIVDCEIFFAVGNTIIVMDVFNTMLTQQYPELPECAQIHKLSSTIHAGNQQLLVACCTDRCIYFDPVYGDWINNLSNGVLLYVCPDDNYRAIEASSINTINNVNISSGICFESQNRTYFAYSDQQHNNVYVYDFFTQNYFPVSPYDCTCQDCICPQLLLLENQYLVIRDANHDLVLDTHTNFSLIINISNVIADILAVLHGNVITPSPPIVCTSTNSLDFTSAITRPAPIIIHSTSAMTQVSTGITQITPSTLITSHEHTSVIHTNIPTSVTVGNNSVGIILTVVIGLFVIIVILVTVAAGFSIQHWRRKWCNTTSYRIPRLRLRSNRSPTVSLLAAGSAREEEDSESYEMESMASNSMESQFGKGWRWTTTV